MRLFERQRPPDRLTSSISPTIKRCSPDIFHTEKRAERKTRECLSALVICAKLPNKSNEFETFWWINLQLAQKNLASCAFSIYTK